LQTPASLVKQIQKFLHREFGVKLLPKLNNRCINKPL
jgi:hypothetical protein